MVTYGDAKQADSPQLNTVGGDLLVLLSGLCYAAYTVRHAPPSFDISTNISGHTPLSHSAKGLSHADSSFTSPKVHCAVIVRDRLGEAYWRSPISAAICRIAVLQESHVAALHLVAQIALRSCFALQIAIRKMLQDDGSLSMMLFFGFVGALNAACLAPVLLILHLAGFVSASSLTPRVFALTVCKGMSATASACRRVMNAYWRLTSA